MSDLFCLSNAVFTSLMLIRTFGTGSQSGMSWHYQLPMVLYAFMNVTQLGVLLLAPQLFQQRRFQVRCAFVQEQYAALGSWDQLGGVG